MTRTTHPAATEGARDLHHPTDLQLAAVLRALLHATKGKRLIYGSDTVPIVPGTVAVWEVWLAGTEPDLYPDTKDDPQVWAYCVDLLRSEDGSTFLERHSWGVASSAAEAVSAAVAIVEQLPHGKG
jgi:hypothetical protein